MEEAVQMVGSAARAGVDIAAELLKILAPALAKGGLKILGAGGKLIGYGINKAASSIDNAKAAGTVSHANLLVEAAKEKTSVKCTEIALPQSATDEIVRLAENYKIPIAINGNGASHTISYLERDADTFQQIMQDWQEKRFAPREGVIPMTTFTVNENEMSAIRGSFEQQGVECFFTRDQNGELRCAFDSADREKVELIKSEYLKSKSEIDKIKISDGENNIEINIDKTTHKSDVEALFKENFGYDDVRAELAANKLADEFGLGETYFEPKVEASITQNIDKMMVDIKYSSDDISIRDISFSAVKLKGRENIQINIANGDEQVLVEPSALSDEELKTVFKEHLGMSELQAEKAVVKARKIDGQIMDRLRETVHTHTGSESLGIERTSSNSFIVKAGEQTKVYDFSQADLERVISEDFKIPAENAKSIISKAKSQSVVQNKIRENTNKKRKEAKLKNDPFKSENRSSKKVTR